MVKAPKTHELHIRLTAEEYNSIRLKAVKYTSISHYIRCAIANYNDTSVTQRVDDIRLLCNFYKKYHSILFHTTANLNQSMKRANELSSAGLLTGDYITDTLHPIISLTSDNIIHIRRELEALTTALCHNI